MLIYVLKLFITTIFLVQVAEAGSHSYLMQTRGTQNHLYVSQDLNGSYGTSIIRSSDGQTDKNNWQGYGLSTRIGLETLRFIRLSVFHTLINLEKKSDSLSMQDGSRLGLSLETYFTSPIANLVGGVAATATRIRLRQGLEADTMVGSGHQLFLGFERFFSTQVSFFSRYINQQETLHNQNSHEGAATIQTKSHKISVGFSLWM